MLYYNRIDVSEGVDINKSSASKKCIISCYWYSLNKAFECPTVCNECYNVLMISNDINSMAIVNIYTTNYRYINVGITTIEAINLL